MIKKFLKIFSFAFLLAGFCNFSKAEADSLDRMMERYSNCTSDSCRQDTGRFVTRLSAAKGNKCNNNKGSNKDGKGKTSRAKKGGNKGGGKNCGNKGGKGGNKGGGKGGGKGGDSCMSTSGEAILVSCPASFVAYDGRSMPLSSSSTAPVYDSGTGLTTQFCTYQFSTPFQDDLIVLVIEFFYSAKPRNEKNPFSQTRYLCDTKNSLKAGDGYTIYGKPGASYLFYSDERQLVIDLKGNITAVERDRIVKKMFDLYGKLGATCVPAKCAK